PTMHGGVNFYGCAARASGIVVLINERVIGEGARRSEKYLSSNAWQRQPRKQGALSNTWHGAQPDAPGNVALRQRETARQATFMATGGHCAQSPGTQPGRSSGFEENAQHAAQRFGSAP